MLTVTTNNWQESQGGGGNGLINPVNNNNSIQTGKNLFVNGYISATGNIGTSSNLGVGIPGSAGPTGAFHVLPIASSSKALIQNCELYLDTGLGGSVINTGPGFSYDSNNLCYLLRKLPVANASTNTGLMDLFCINATGYVGIGKTKPLYNLDINGDSNTSGNIYTKGKQIIRKIIGNSIYSNSSTNFFQTANVNTFTWSNCFSTTYTRLSNNSTIEIIADLNLSIALGAIGIQSYASCVGRLVLTNPSSNTLTSGQVLGWTRNDNGYFEISNMKKLIYSFTDTNFLTAGQTVTITAQVLCPSRTGTITGFGINGWLETSYITINEYI